jgi:hypothetical protein
MSGVPLMFLEMQSIHQKLFFWNSQLAAVTDIMTADDR